MYGPIHKNPSICDICGQKWQRIKLKRQVIAGKPTKLLCCPECWDQDNPQLLLGRLRVSDPHPIQEPRPDINFPYEAGFGWNPVSNEGLSITVYPTNFLPNTSNGSNYTASTSNTLRLDTANSLLDINKLNA
ncbi:hypothetical protein UFOVP28_45 [uncultured Caudovirales phage]|uniref:Uncharacterized protein n=1 Tax=uncultured Caudovirales phage TaxID=2100421 RepID=A0A6J5KRA8_9CAUD|nr:hypothetical protein UFOVP28_45 [uncultured Caudovirales phage]